MLYDGPVKPLRDPQVRREIEELYLAYVDCLDEGPLERWPALFTADAVYRVVARENEERGWPLATLSCEGRPAIEDRVYAIEHTSFHVPRRQRHLLGPLRMVEDDGGYRVEANYAVFETLPEEHSRPFSVGRYRDRIVRDADGALRFAEKLCLYDSALVPNTLVLPL